MTGPAAAAAAVVATAGCEPADGLGSRAVSVTTDQPATQAPEHDKVDVMWLWCSATTGKKQAKVDCLGRTADRQRITVKGTVTRQTDGRCVQGGLTAVVGGRTVFDVRGLGNCAVRTAASS
jgi:hypothetical protein